MKDAWINGSPCSDGSIIETPQFRQIYAQFTLWFIDRYAFGCMNLVASREQPLNILFIVDRGEYENGEKQSAV